MRVDSDIFFCDGEKIRKKRKKPGLGMHKDTWPNSVLVLRTPGEAKAFKAVFALPNGRTRTIRFGTESNYVLNPQTTKQDREAYIARHAAPKSRENHGDPMTAGALSRYVLWGASRSWTQNLAAFKRRFGLN